MLIMWYRSRPSLVLHLFKQAVDGSLNSRGLEVDISVHSNTSGEQECDNYLMSAITFISSTNKM